ACVDSESTDNRRTAFAARVLDLLPLRARADDAARERCADALQQRSAVTARQPSVTVDARADPGETGHRSSETEATHRGREPRTHVSIVPLRGREPVPDQPFRLEANVCIHIPLTG